MWSNTSKWLYYAINSYTFCQETEAEISKNALWKVSFSKSKMKNFLHHGKNLLLLLHLKHWQLPKKNKQSTKTSHLFVHAWQSRKAFSSSVFILFIMVATAYHAWQPDQPCRKRERVKSLLQSFCHEESQKVALIQFCWWCLAPKNK